MNENPSFNEYLSQLRESLDCLAIYWEHIGYECPHIDHIASGLKNADPFVLYNASIAATLLLSDESIYH